jgi:hypothetical protein
MATSARQYHLASISLEISNYGSLGHPISGCQPCRKVDLDNEVTETQAAQIQLDKTAEDFKALHGERQELVGFGWTLVRSCCTSKLAVFR